MITSLGWQSLEQRRQNSRLYMLYKIQHNLIDINRVYILGIATAGLEANIAFSKKEPTTKHTGIPSSNEQSETGTSYQPAQLLQLPSRSLGLTLRLAPPVARHGPHVYNFNCKNMERFRCK
jgi:hypothetical protein